MSDLPNLYAWCFDHGRMHVFDPEKPWCTAAWVPLDGHAEAEAVADKQTRYGNAQFLHDLPDGLHLAVIRERIRRQATA